MKRTSFSLVVATLSLVIGLPAPMVAQGQGVVIDGQETQGQPGTPGPGRPISLLPGGGEVRVGGIDNPSPGQAESCNQKMGANFQPVNNGNGLVIISLDAGGLLNKLGFQQGDIFESIQGVKINDVPAFCSIINSNAGKVVQIIYMDVNTNQQYPVMLRVP